MLLHQHAHVKRQQMAGRPHFPMQTTQQEASTQYPHTSYLGIHTTSSPITRRIHKPINPTQPWKEPHTGALQPICSSFELNPDPNSIHTVETTAPAQTQQLELTADITITHHSQHWSYSSHFIVECEKSKFMFMMGSNRILLVSCNNLSKSHTILGETTQYWEKQSSKKN